MSCFCPRGARFLAIRKPFYTKEARNVCLRSSSSSESKGWKQLSPAELQEIAQMAQWMPDPRGEDELFAEDPEPNRTKGKVSSTRESIQNERRNRGPPGWKFRAVTSLDEALDVAVGEEEWEASAEAYRQAVAEREGNLVEEGEEEELEEEEGDAGSTWSFDETYERNQATEMGDDIGQPDEFDERSDLEKESDYFDAFWDEKMLKDQFSQLVKEANSRLKRKAAKDLPNGIFGLVKLAAQVEKELWYKYQRQPSYHPTWKSISCLAILHLDENWDTIMARLKPPVVSKIEVDDDNEKLRALMDDPAFGAIWKRIGTGGAGMEFSKPDLEDTVDAEPMEGPRQDEHGWYIMHWYPEGKKEKIPLSVHRTIHVANAR